jgi:hypothetical protein
MGTATHLVFLIHVLLTFLVAKIEDEKLLHLAKLMLSDGLSLPLLAGQRHMTFVN